MSNRTQSQKWENETQQESWCLNSAMATRIRLPSILATAVTLTVLAASLTWAAGSPEATFVKKTISSHQIVIFSKSYCPYNSLSLSRTPTFWCIPVWKLSIYLRLTKPIKVLLWNIFLWSQLSRSNTDSFLLLLISLNFTFYFLFVDSNLL